MRQTKAKIIKHFYYTLYIVPLILSLFVLSNNTVHNTSALEYQNATNVQFTFEPTISVSVSDDLVIDELSPGTAKDSNIVNVTVSTNVLAGYYLSATTGTKNTNTDLSHTSGNDYKFTNLSVNKTTVESFNDNTWGYSYSNDGGATWVSGNVSNPVAGYNGLPKDNNDANDANNTNDTNATNSTSSELGKGGTTLINTNSDADSSTIKFKIGAKAAMTQSAGTYTNTINFYAVSKVPPISISDAFAAAGKTKTSSGYYKMQDMDTTICAMTQTIDEESQTQLLDIRDNKVYWVAKLRDDHCWMTQNLDLNLDSTVALTSNDTNLVQYNTGGYVDGYSCSNSDPACIDGIISWMPERSTSTTISDYWIGNNDDYATSGRTNPYSYDAGVGYPDARIAQIEAGDHGLVGNYYNWTAAIASNDSTSINAETYYDISINPQNSICSKGWRIPTIANQSGAISNSANEFNRLNILYNNGSNASIDNFLAAPLYMVRSGLVSSKGVDGSGTIGHFWSSTNAATNSGRAFSLLYYSGFIDTDNDEYFRSNGFSIRCLAK